MTFSHFTRPSVAMPPTGRGGTLHAEMDMRTPDSIFLPVISNVIYFLSETSGDVLKRQRLQIVTKAKPTMQAGFAAVRITPPLGTRMYGWSGRDKGEGCKAVHDDLFARAVFLSHNGEEVLIMGFDLLFFSRAQADQFKGAIGRVTGLAPHQILLNASHTHAGPMLGMGTWTYADYLPPDRLYLTELEQHVLSAAGQARAAAREVTIWAAAGRSDLPISRRRIEPDGKVAWGPNPNAVTYRDLPICLLKGLSGKPVCLMFSVSCHPSTFGTHEISADFPGVASDLIDKHLGVHAGLFLQGVGGDTKASTMVTAGKFVGSWEAVTRAGEMVAAEVIEALDCKLTQIKPDLQAYLTEMHWPLTSALDKAGYKAVADHADDQCKRWWAERQLRKLERGSLPTSVPITVHGIQLGRGLRMVGLEGEAVAELGLLIRKFYGQGITFPMGYTNGCMCYLPTSRMIEKEGGYEVESYWEYGLPAGLAPGGEDILLAALRDMRTRAVS